MQIRHPSTLRTDPQLRRSTLGIITEREREEKVTCTTSHVNLIGLRQHMEESICLLAREG